MDQQMKIEETATTESGAERCYSEYSSYGDFCPHKDLNFPSSYAEVLARFRNLQRERAIEMLN